MRRGLLALAALMAALAAIGAVVLGDEDGDSTRVVATFDRAAGIIPGQQVKVAGVVAGRIAEVELAPGPKARIAMDVDDKYTPFHADATCTILPEGLLSENFVSCDPGSKSQPPLGEAGVPLRRTTVPASLQDVLDVFSVPTNQRLRLLFSQLGVATAGHGDDINELLRRSNPALTQAQNVLDILDTQRDQLTTGIRQTKRVLANLKTGDVRGFVRRSGELASTLADHSPKLGEAVRRLPPMLASARPALKSLDSAMDSGTTLLRNVRAATPQLENITRSVPGFVKQGLPALDTVESIATRGQRTLPTLKPVVKDLRKAASLAAPLTPTTTKFLNSLRDQGAIEGLMSVLYAVANATAAYDDLSHIVGLYVKTFPQCLADAKARGCSTKYDQPGQGLIPPDDPDCGPQDGALWQPATDCRSENAIGSRRQKRSGKGTQRPDQQLRKQSDRPSGSGAPIKTPDDQRVPSLLEPLIDALSGLGDLLPTPETEKQDSSTTALLDFLLKP